MNSLTKSWKTTVAGVVAGLSILIPQILSLIESGAGADLDTGQIILGLSFMGFGMAARDGNKSSQDHAIR